MDIEAWTKDPGVVVGAAVAGGILLILILRALVVRGRARAKENARLRSRERLRKGVLVLREDLRKALEGCRPVFARVEAETGHAAVVGHFRKQMHHVIRYRVPDMGEMKSLARGLGMDATHLADLDNTLRKTGRTVEEYNGGKLDATPTPIATVKQLEKDLERLLVLANLGAQKYG